MAELERYALRHPVRFVTATALFDGHDAAINIIRRILQDHGVEVVHLGHNRSVDEIVEAAVEEDVHGVAVSSYQGGHMEFFPYLVRELRARGAGHVRVYGGGGGVIVPEEIAALRDVGVANVFSPDDGARLGLVAMVESIVRECDFDLADLDVPAVADLAAGNPAAVARTITLAELGRVPPTLRDAIDASSPRAIPVLGITGTGGSGKSSLTDELVRRLRLDQDDSLRIAVLAIDPTRRRGGGALLGDRIRMNAAFGPAVYVRSLATRQASEIPLALDAAIGACQAAGADLVIIETPGIGQGDAGIVPYADVSLYVMTPEFGASSQLEKIDMIDVADVIVVNKFDRRGGADALRDVRRQYARSRGAFTADPESLPIFGTIASRFNDDGVTALYQEIAARLADHGLPLRSGTLPKPALRTSSGARAIVPAARSHYLVEIVDAVRRYQQETGALAGTARLAQQLEAAADHLDSTGRESDAARAAAKDARAGVPPELQEAIDGWPDVRAEYGERTWRSPAGTNVPSVVLPELEEHGTLVHFLREENAPGRFPFTAGVFPFKRDDEDPTRMFAGEGDPFRTNRRFHLLSEGSPATRLSTAFDSVTLYGFDPDERPDIYGKIGNAGVSIATLDDMKALFAGFDLADSTTSVSMTINGPAPTILAMYMNAAIDDAINRREEREGRELAADERSEVRADVLRRVRGTVQADILKEDQGQNTCIFSTEFSLGLMADVQQWFVDQGVRNFYSVSISGYHIAEAGANPITQLAFTLANAFTYVETYLARGMAIDDFAPNLSFFFSNGMDLEYSVLGRVARRIWAIALRDRYGADERSQRLKYHVQTSGRSLHAQEMQFNDVRTTLQALIAVYDNCNSLHTNAFDEAVTTPTEESVRRAVAIQLIINREWGLTRTENVNQGSYVLEELTRLVEQAVLDELEQLDSRGGVLGAMELGYQRGRIQDESMLYEQRKHDGSLPIIGVNTFLRDTPEEPHALTLARSTEGEKRRQLERLRAFGQEHAAERPEALARLRAAALAGENLFAVLMDTVRVCSLGDITEALFEVGGRYRRNV